MQIGLKHKGKPIHLALDTIGLKVYGEGEWKVKQHGAGKRRTWLKVHFAVDIETFDIHCVGVTTNDIADGEVVSDLLSNAFNLSKAYGDGVYDTHESRKAIKTKGGTPIIPPREDAVRHPGKEALFERNKALEDIRKACPIRRPVKNGRKKIAIINDRKLKLVCIALKRLLEVVVDHGILIAKPMKYS